MPLPQDIAPVNSEMMDSIARSASLDWIETKPGQAYMKILWIGPETGRWAVLLKWMKGYVAAPHKHLSAAQVLILKGKLHFIYEPNGMVHGATTALEDTEYLFMCDGPVLYFGDDAFTGYFGWEQLQRLQDQANGSA